MSHNQKKANKPSYVEFLFQQASCTKWLPDGTVKLPQCTKNQIFIKEKQDILIHSALLWPNYCCQLEEIKFVAFPPVLIAAKLTCIATAGVELVLDPKLWQDNS